MGGPQQPQKTVGQISVEIGQLGRSNLFGGSGPDKESGETLAPESFGLGGWILPGEGDEGGDVGLQHHRPHALGYRGLQLRPGQRGREHRTGNTRGSRRLLPTRFFLRGGDPTAALWDWAHTDWGAVSHEGMDMLEEKPGSFLSARFLSLDGDQETKG